MTVSPFQRRHSTQRLFLSKKFRMIFGTICFTVLQFCYWNWIDEPAEYIAFHNQIGRVGTVEKPIASSNNTNINYLAKDNRIEEAKHSNQSLRFYILPSPDISTVLKPVLNQTKSELLKIASKYYDEALNEDCAEMWLHRGFQQLQHAQVTTRNRRDADVYVVVGYFHLFSELLPSSNMWAEKMVPNLYRNVVIDPTKPHLILAPTWNNQRSKNIGLHSLINTLQMRGVSASNLWSVGFERNYKWQPVPLKASRLVPIPYVVQQDERNERFQESIPGTVHSPTNTSRVKNSVFFAGNPRKHADKWAGCSRSNIIDALRKKLKDDPLGKTDLVLLNKRNRMNRSDYQKHIRASEYCLVLCGDTPSSRTLTEAVVGGCIPVRVGSRLRGLCDPPCHEGFGWDVTGPKYPHMPFADEIPWDFFPEIDEASLLGAKKDGDDTDTGKILAKNSSAILQSMFQQNHEVLEKRTLQNTMDRVRSGFIYGYGDPVTSNDFGDAALYIWESFVATLQEENAKNKTAY